MSIINYMLVMKKEQQKVKDEVFRNNSITEEVVGLVLEIDRVKEIIIDNLIFDYLIREEEANTLFEMCTGLDVDYKSITRLVQIESIGLLREDFKTEEIAEMTWGDVANNLIRIHKRLILLQIMKEYPDIYDKLSARAEATVNKVVMGAI